VSILYRFRDKAAYSSKVADFDPPHLHSAPWQGVTSVEFRGDLWNRKTRVPGLSCGVVCVIVCLAVLVELRLVTDRQRDRQTQTDTGPWLVPRMHSIARYKVTHVHLSENTCQTFFLYYLLSLCDAHILQRFIVDTE